MTDTQIDAEIARIESLPDEDLLAEVRAEGLDLEEVAERTRAVFEPKYDLKGCAK